jgi:hypothetical protein
VRNYNKYLPIVLVLFIVLIFNNNLSAQCAMCKQAAESSLKNNPHSLARSLNSGILYLMAIPYVMLGFIFRKQLYKLYKKLIGKPL